MNTSRHPGDDQPKILSDLTHLYAAFGRVPHPLSLYRTLTSKFDTDTHYNRLFPFAIPLPTPNRNPPISLKLISASNTSYQRCETFRVEAMASQFSPDILSLKLRYLPFLHFFPSFFRLCQAYTQKRVPYLPSLPALF